MYVVKHKYIIYFLLMISIIGILVGDEKYYTLSAIFISALGIIEAIENKKGE